MAVFLITNNELENTVPYLTTKDYLVESYVHNKSLDIIADILGSPWLLLKSVRATECPIEVFKFINQNRNLTLVESYRFFEKSPFQFVWASLLNILQACYPLRYELIEEGVTRKGVEITKSLSLFSCICSAGVTDLDFEVELSYFTDDPTALIRLIESHQKRLTNQQLYDVFVDDSYKLTEVVITIHFTKILAELINHS